MSNGGSTHSTGDGRTEPGLFRCLNPMFTRLR
jgi:hypothetical protein